MSDEKDEGLVVFQDSKIRRIPHNGEWFYSVIDIIAVLSESDNPAIYWRVLKHREPQLVTICNGLKMVAEDGKMRLTDCVNTKNAFRLIQSIPSKKAEPFKQWLAQLAKERIDEIKDPELAQKRMKEIYKARGYSDEWTEKRVRGIAIRDELTDEWGKRGVKTDKEYAMLTAEISKATFDMTPSEYKEFKGLKRENLRDHMDDMELVLAMLGEATTTRFTRDRDSQGFPPLKNDAKDGGDVAGATRKDIEQRLGKRVVSDENFLDKPEGQKRLEQKKDKRQIKG
jgi:hypothetical protein